MNVMDTPRMSDGKLSRKNTFTTICHTLAPKL